MDIALELVELDLISTSQVVISCVQLDITPKKLVLRFAHLIMFLKITHVFLLLNNALNPSIMIQIATIALTVESLAQVVKELPIDAHLALTIIILKTLHAYLIQEYLVLKNVAAAQNLISVPHVLLDMLILVAIV